MVSRGQPEHHLAADAAAAVPGWWGVPAQHTCTLLTDSPTYALNVY